MSNHYHLVLTDTNASLPRFMEWFNKHTTKCLNRHLMRRGAIWDPEDRYNAVELCRAEDVVDKLVYIYVNPIRAGLVLAPSEWTGLSSSPNDFSRPLLHAKRPEIYFRSNSNTSLPAEVTTVITVPPALRASGLDPERYRSEIENALSVATKEILSSPVCANPITGKIQDPRGEKQDRPAQPRLERQLNPTLACKDAELRKDMIEQLRLFRAQYRDARERYLRGEIDVEFPAGTYWLRVHMGVRCAAPPTSAA